LARQNDNLPFLGCLSRSSRFAICFETEKALNLQPIEKIHIAALIFHVDQALDRVPTRTVLAKTYPQNTAIADSATN
jgi:hypothetical protein